MPSCVGNNLTLVAVRASSRRGSGTASLVLPVPSSSLKTRSSQGYSVLTTSFPGVSGGVTGAEGRG